MGPRSHERGNDTSGVGIGETLDTLQWGRVLTNAETRRPLPPRRRAIGRASMGPRSHERGNGSADQSSSTLAVRFNGAAFSRTRKRARFDMPRAAGKELQWGRVLTNAETPPSQDVGDVHEYASMGPRSHERGNHSPRLWSSALFLTLQWGRVLTNAETPIVSGQTLGSLRLQWGRVLTNAETSPVFKAWWDRWCASMGPRSHERGNS